MLQITIEECMCIYMHLHYNETKVCMYYSHAMHRLLGIAVKFVFVSVYEHMCRSQYQNGLVHKYRICFH